MDGVYHVRDQEMQHTHGNIARLTLEVGKTSIRSLFIVVSVVLARRVKSKVKLIQVCMKFVVDEFCLSREGNNLPSQSKINRMALVTDCKHSSVIS